MRPQMGTQFFMEGPNWDPISVTRDPNVDPNVAPIVDPIVGPNCVFAYSFEQNRFFGLRRGLEWSVYRASLPA